MKKCYLSIVFFILSFNAFSQTTLYWRNGGGADDWGNLNKWSTISGIGGSCNCKPTILDDVIFDNNLAAPTTINMNEVGQVKSIDFNSVDAIYTINNANPLQIYGRNNANTFSFRWPAINNRLVINANTKFMTASLDYTIITPAAGAVAWAGNIDAGDGSNILNSITITGSSAKTFGGSMNFFANTAIFNGNTTMTNNTISFERTTIFNNDLTINSSGDVKFNNSNHIDYFTDFRGNTNINASTIYSNAKEYFRGNSNLLNVAFAVFFGGSGGRNGTSHTELTSASATLTVTGGDPNWGAYFNRNFNSKGSIFALLSPGRTFQTQSQPTSWYNNITIGPNITGNFSDNSGQLMSVTGLFTINSNAKVNVGSRTVLGPMLLMQGSRYQNNGQSFLPDFHRYNESVTLSGSNQFVLGNFSQHSFTGSNTFVHLGACNSWSTLKSSENNVGNDTKLYFSSPTTITSLIVQDIKNQTGTFRCDNCVNLGNNTSINFNVTTTSGGNTLYWIGRSAAGAGTNWSNASNWSLSSGGAAQTCIPNEADNVIFDVNSFNATGQRVNVDLINTSFRNMTWMPNIQNDITFNSTLPGAQLYPYGSVTLAGVNKLNNLYPNEWTFSSNSTTTANGITSNGNSFNGKVSINNHSTTWFLNDNLTLLKDIVLYRGTLDASATGSTTTSVNINLYGNWNESGYIVGQFLPRTGTVSFVGTNLQDVYDMNSYTAPPPGQNTVNPFFNMVFDNPSGIRFAQSFVGGVTVQNNAQFKRGMVNGNGYAFNFGSTATASNAAGSAITQTTDMTNSGTGNNGSNSWYYNGNMTKAGTAAFTFPIGTNTLYRPLSITAPTLNPTFSVMYNRGNVGNSKVTDGSLGHASAVEWYDMNSTVPNASTQVSLSWYDNGTTSGGVGDGPGGTLSSYLDLRVAQLVGSNWTNRGGAPSNTLGNYNFPVTGNNNGGRLNSGSIASWPSSGGRVTLGSLTSANTLPLNFIYFYAKRNENIVNLKWKVATSECKNCKFIIEKSFDGIGFSSIDSLLYTLNDIYESETVSMINTLMYYRIVSIDDEKKKTYSEIRVVSSHEFTSQVFPNPASSSMGSMTLLLQESSLETPTVVTLLDLLGHSLLVQTFYAPGEYSIPIDHYHSGTYLLITENGNHKDAHKILIK